uniref:Zinc finger protein 787 n=1 Tax=Molossus molossus TaxID=27622 RepID=A0A7J8CD51_MOLMO|nr:zinc finger protein 787 [Molossus molossus]
MELREEAWSPGPLDSEDQQMASHENPDKDSKRTKTSQLQNTYLMYNVPP